MQSFPEAVSESSVSVLYKWDQYTMGDLILDMPRDPIEMESHLISLKKNLKIFDWKKKKSLKIFDRNAL